MSLPFGSEHTNLWYLIKPLMKCQKKVLSHLHALETGELFGDSLSTLRLNGFDALGLLLTASLRILDIALDFQGFLP